MVSSIFDKSSCYYDSARFNFHASEVFKWALSHFNAEDFIQNGFLDKFICNILAVVTGVSNLVPVSVGLVRVGNEGAVVSRIINAIIVRVIVAGISCAITVSILLAGVGEARAVVLSAAWLRAVESNIRPIVVKRKSKSKSKV